MQLWQRCLYAVGRDRREHDETGLESVRGVVDRLERRIASEIRDAPAVRAQCESERHQAQFVPLTGKASQEGNRTDAATPPACQAE